jgi:hypothetical protein
MIWVETLDVDPVIGWAHLHFATEYHQRHIRVSIHIADLEGQNICWSELQIENGHSILGPVYDLAVDFNPYPYKDEVLAWAEDKLVSPFSRLVESLNQPTDQTSCQMTKKMMIIVDGPEGRGY